MKRLYGFSLAMAVALLTVLAPPQAGAEGGVQLGILTCWKVPGSGMNLVISSSADVECEFASPYGKETYKGRSGIGIGLDLEWSAEKVIGYAVFGATSDVRMGSHSLAGKYVGGKVSATVGLGVGTQVLVGGGEKNITLQPLALEVSTGFGAAAGIGYLYLEPA